MLMRLPITREHIRTHFHYAWWQYVLLVCLAIFGWNLLYTTTATAVPNPSKWNGTARVWWLPRPRTSWTH